MSPARRNPPQPPVELPDGVFHGTSFAHRWFKCRCIECQAWRREYDKDRKRDIRDGKRIVRKQGKWYVCITRWGQTFGEHEYNWNGRCIRCGADRETEEFWERKWQESSNGSPSAGTGSPEA